MNCFACTGISSRQAGIREAHRVNRKAHPVGRNAVRRVQDSCSCAGLFAYMGDLKCYWIHFDLVSDTLYQTFCCDKTVIIPMAPDSESLNAAVAAAVLMWEMTR